MVDSRKSPQAGVDSCVISVPRRRVAGPGSGGQLLWLPPSGEIPDRESVAAQWELAQLILERQPPDPLHQH